MEKEEGKEQLDTGCCPRFNPEPWQDKEVTFEDRLFLKDSVRSFLHVPLNFGSVMTKNMAKIEAAGAKTAEPLVLSDEISMWKSDVYISVTREVPGAEMVRLSGTYLTKVFEGPYNGMSGWVKAMKQFAASRNKEIKKLYFFYTTCPKCAKVYGKNYTVLLAEV